MYTIFVIFVKERSKSVLNQTTNHHKLLQVFPKFGPKLAPSWPQVGPSWPKLAPSWPQVGHLGGSWGHLGGLGGHLGPKTQKSAPKARFWLALGRPSWSQNGAKIDKKNDAKFD